MEIVEDTGLCTGQVALARVTMGYLRGERGGGEVGQREIDFPSHHGEEEEEEEEGKGGGGAASHGQV